MFKQPGTQSRHIINISYVFYNMLEINTKKKTHIHSSNINTKESVNMAVILTTSAFRIINSYKFYLLKILCRTLSKCVFSFLITNIDISIFKADIFLAITLGFILLATPLFIYIILPQTDLFVNAFFYINNKICQNSFAFLYSCCPLASD